MSESPKSVRTAELPPPKRIFLSSTADDLKQHRECVTDVIERLGQTTMRMEVFGARPGTPLEECRKLAAESDGLVVIVAHRYGWVPTAEDGGDGKKSITWHEVEAAMEAEKPVFPFLVDEQMAWGFGKEQDRLLDAESDEEVASLRHAIKSLKEFKALLSKQIRDTFTTPEDLAAKVSASLSRWLLERQHVDVAEGDCVASCVIPPQYLEWLRSDCGGVDLLGMEVKEGRAVRISNVYVPLTTRSESEDGQIRRKKNPQDADELINAREEKPQLLLDLFDKDSLYVSGAPGSGKSTFCRWVAWLACTGSMSTQIVRPENDNYVEQYPQSFPGRLPLLIRLRDFWEVLPTTPNREELSASQLRDAVVDWVDRRQSGGLAGSHVRAHVDHGSLLLIFDGVDEVPITLGQGSQQARPRALLLSGLAAAAAEWTKRGNRLLITSRPYGLTATEGKKLGLREAPINDLDADLQQLLVRRWFHSLIEDDAAAESTAADMLEHARAVPGIADLAFNPLLLTAMCIIYHEGKRLPQDRHDLYDRIVRTVLYGRYPKDPVEIDVVRNRLAVVAYGMHTGEGLDELRKQPQAEVTVPEIDKMIQAYQDQTSWKEAGYKGALEAREQLLTRTGLLLPQGEQRAAFYHLTLQDFMAAQRLLDLQEDGLFDVFRQRGTEAEWRSTMSFVFGAQLAKHSSPQRSVRLLGALVASLQAEDLRLGIVVGDCLRLLLKRDLRLQEALENKFREFCLSAIEREVSLQDRFDLGMSLGHVGDPRIVTDLQDQAAYVEVPAGSYPFGEDRKRRKLKTAFLISRYPVTNSQYELFINEGGYADRQYWSDAGWKWVSKSGITEPRLWHDARWNGPNQPVVAVSLWEAEAFANWVGGRLPNEEEWEAAARGPEGFEYPWGNDWEDGICNSAETGLNVTSPVGIFPRSRSAAFQLDGMAGNVWEWCTDKISSDLRVVRGGSWVNGARYCRAAFRYWLHPDVRNNYGGFRVLYCLQNSP